MTSEERAERAEQQLAQALRIIDAAWLAVPLRFRDPNADHETGNPLPACVRVMAQALKGAGGGLR